MERAPSALDPFHWRPQKFFQGGDNVDILLILFRFMTMQLKRMFAKRFTHSTQKEIAPFDGNNHKKCTSVTAIARHFEISYTKQDYLISADFSNKQGTFFTKKQISVVFNKTTFMCLVCPARLARII